jgi:medium-chain acyl-[acyl-carrier-protein] hydrolase
MRLSLCEKMRDFSNELAHVETYRVRGYDVDLHKKAGIPAIIQMMHDAAMEHVLKLGLSAVELDPLGLGWVLVRQQLQVYRQPALGATVTVETRPTGRDRAFAYRDFYLYDSEGTVLATATTTWLLMDIHTRRIARYPDFINVWLDKSQTPHFLPRPTGDFPVVKNPLVEKSFQVNWHDLDFNRHLTNFYYQKWMLETTPVEILENYRLEAYSIQFKGEGLLGDTLQVYSEALAPGVFAYSIRKDGQETTSGYARWAHCV